MPTLSIHSPLGPLTVTEQDGAVTVLDWGWSEDAEKTPLLCRARDQLAEYFDGMREDFDLPLAPDGTPFQQAVWTRMRDIPFGRAESYGDIAHEIGSGPRAVGSACAGNPIPILIPCHRVVGHNGALGGYSGGDGVGSKQYLLNLEGCFPPPQQSPSLLSAHS
jgi:methylated-DNA-[protein]-cysteine S-methyltransferase